MGGAGRVAELAQQAMDRGDNRWAIEILGYLVRSQPGHDAARKLDAEAHRRKGLAKHNATWRNWYLTGVLEVLDGAADDADATVRFTDKAALVAYLTGTALDELVASSRVKIDGDREAVARFSTYLDPPPDPSRILVTLHGPA